MPAALARISARAARVPLADAERRHVLLARAARGVDAAALLPQAVARGVAFVPGAAFYADAPRANTLRLSFVTVGAALIERGIAALAGALGELRDDGARAQRRAPPPDAPRSRHDHLPLHPGRRLHRTPLQGNPLAVVHGADALDAGPMQAFASWTNLSETTFLLAPTDPSADYRVRIFTPSRELPFAGHPTLGSCHAWLGAAAGRASRRRRAGVRRRPGAHPPRGAGSRSRRRRCAQRPGRRRGCSTRSRRAAARAAALVAPVGRQRPGLGRGAARLGGELLALEPDLAADAPPRSAWSAPSGRQPRRVRGARLRRRPSGLEDPVTGSLNASLAMADRRRPRRPIATSPPGHRLGRAGRVHVDAGRRQIWVGGDSVTCIRGEVTL